MEADLVIPKIFRPFSNVLQHQFIDIRTSGAEQSNNISCSVVPRIMDFPIPIRFFQMVADDLQLFARGFSRESDEPVKCLHLGPLIENEVVYQPGVQVWIREQKVLGYPQVLASKSGYPSDVTDEERMLAAP